MVRLEPVNWQSVQYWLHNSTVNYNLSVGFELFLPLHPECNVESTSASPLMLSYPSEMNVLTVIDELWRAAESEAFRLQKHRLSSKLSKNTEIKQDFSSFSA